MCERDTGTFSSGRSGAEVTPEMIAAGKAALYAYDEAFYTDEEIVLRIYEDMERVRKARQ